MFLVIFILAICVTFFFTTLDYNLIILFLCVCVSLFLAKWKLHLKWKLHRIFYQKSMRCLTVQWKRNWIWFTIFPFFFSTNCLIDMSLTDRNDQINSQHFFFFFGEFTKYQIFLRFFFFLSKYFFVFVFLMNFTFMNLKYSVLILRINSQFFF